MNLLKKLLKILFSVFIILTALLWLLVKLLSPDMLSPYLSQELTKLTSLETHINGGIKWRLFPHPAFRINSIQFGGNSTQENYSLLVDKLFLNLKIFPLLQGKLEFNDLEIMGMQLHIRTKQKIAQDTKAPSKEADPDNLNIEHFFVTQGHLSFIEGEELLTLSGLQIAAEKIHSFKEGFPIQLKAHLSYSRNSTELIKAQIQFRGMADLRTLLKQGSNSANTTPLSGQLIMQDLQLANLKIDKLSANLSLKKGQLSLNPLALKLYQGEAMGSLNYDFNANDLKIDQTATNLEFANLSKDLFKQKIIQGKADISLHSQTELKAMKDTFFAQANGSISIKDGRFLLINLDKLPELLQPKAPSTPDQVPTGSDKRNQQTSSIQGAGNFKLFTLKYQVNNAILSSDNLLLQTDKLQLKGEMRLNLEDFSLAGQLNLILPEAELSKMDQELNKTLLLQGSLQQPSLELKKIPSNP